MNKLWIIWVFSASLVLSTSAVKAGDSGDESGEPANHLALFLGVTHAEEDNAAPTVGLDYERRVSERLGVGIVFRDHASGDIDSTLYAVSFLSIRPHRCRSLLHPALSARTVRTALCFELAPNTNSRSALAGHWRRPCISTSQRTIPKKFWASRLDSVFKVL
jgi:hypothetical protein